MQSPFPYETIATSDTFYGRKEEIKRLKLKFQTLYEKFTNIFKKVRVEPTFDANSSKFSLRPVVATFSFKEMIEDFFDALQELTKEKRLRCRIDTYGTFFINKTYLELL